MVDIEHKQGPVDNTGTGGGAREVGEAMEDGEIRSLVAQMIDEAKIFNDEDLAPLRETATKYYQAEPYGNEEENRSQIVTTEVADTVLSMLPSLLRIFTGPERAVEFRPRGKSDDAISEQQTDYTNYVIFEDNDGFIQHYSAMKDALVRKIGVYKWWWDDAEHEDEAEYTGLTEENLEVLLDDDEVDVEITAIDDTTEPVTFDAIVKHTHAGRVRFGALPGEEISWNRSARTVDDARIMVHTREVRVDDLLALGYEYSELEDAIGSSIIGEQNIDGEARVAHLNSSAASTDDESMDWFTRPIRFDEAYVYLNLDGEQHEASLVKVSMVGDHHGLLDYEKVSHRPFSIICPIPEPHTIVGLSIADRVMDLQIIGSSVMRGTLDSLSMALDPRMEAVDGQVNFDDLMNPEIGGVYRVRQPGMLREVAHRFVGGDTLPFMQYLGEIKENRTGQSKAAQGLDADALQSSTKAAVAATITASQQQIEMVARIFAETGIKSLYKGILRTLVEHQDFERVVRLRDEYVTIDPRAWNTSMDVVTNVGLGVGMPEERVASLREIVNKQEQVMGALGPLASEIVGISQYSNALADLVKISGRPNTEKYFTRVTKEKEEELKAAQEAAAAQEPQGDPANMLIAQAEMMKAQAATKKQEAEIQAKQQELQIRSQEVQLRDQREREKNTTDAQLREKELGLKYTTVIDRVEVDADRQLERSLIEAETRRVVAAIQAEGNLEAAEVRSSANATEGD